MSVTLITGASKGIGRALAFECAQNGDDILLVARSKDLLMQLKSDLKKQFSVSVYVYSCDLTDVNQRKGLFEYTVEHQIFVSTLVNNAGIGSNGLFWEQERDWEQSIVELNIKALVDLTHLFLPAMIDKKCGAILNIASLAAFSAGPKMATYYASKAFVVSFSQALAHELKNTEVSVCVYCPGGTESEFGVVSGNGDTVLFNALPVASSQAVAKDAYSKLRRKKKVAYFGLTGWMTAKLSTISPAWITTLVASWLNAKWN